jgi:electron transfer flavoprotein alpha subunit
VTVLALLEHGVPASSAALLEPARALGGQLDTPLVAVVDPGACAPGAVGQALADLVAELGPAAVVAPATDRSTDVMAHLAAVAGLPLATNCTAIRPPTPVDHGRTALPGGGEGRSARDQQEGAAAAWVVSRIRAGGVLLEEAELDAPTALLTLAPGTTVPSSVDHATPVRHADLSDLDGLEVRDLVITPGTERIRLVERATAATGVTLATAPVVVSGGRGVGSAENFAVLEELAELLGGAVGCSRVATNNGWRPHRDQVGQTGTKVSPDLYIAAGISGATQHWAGCMGSKTILAINTDPEAPMVTRAHYAVVGDAVEVLRAVADEIRSRRPR